MNGDNIPQTFRQSLTSEITLAPEGVDRFRVFAPFGFDDGDEFVIVLKHAGGFWELSDEGNTLMHLSYDMNVDTLSKGARGDLFKSALLMHDIDNRNGELVAKVKDQKFALCLFTFVQGLTRISDLTYLSRERVRTTFKEDVQSWLSVFVPEKGRTFDWHDHARDPQGRYQVDCRINGRHPPVFVHALSNNDRTRDATIALHRFAEWNLDFEPVGIFKKKARITRSVRERFEDVCKRTYVGLEENEESIRRDIASLTSDYY